VTPPALYGLGQPAAALLFFILSLLLWFMHRANIARLMDGSEGKIGQR
jgi:glycerol-3-phosphate acyltransferase PlsY